VTDMRIPLAHPASAGPSLRTMAEMAT